jgi:hypothetical protein
MNDITGRDKHLREACLEVNLALTNHGGSNVVVAVAVIIVVDKVNLIKWMIRVRQRK